MLRRHRQLRKGDVLAVLTETANGTILHAVEVTDGQGRRGIHRLNSLTEARMHFLHQRQQFVRPLLFPLFVVLTTSAYGGILPPLHHIKLHGRRHQHFVRTRSLVLHWWCHQQESHRP